MIKAWPKIALDEYDEHPVEKPQLKFKSRILSQMLKIKLGVFNSLVI